MKKKVLVVVIGWWSSLDRHVEKYASLYKRFGYQTYTYNPPPSLFFKPWQYDNATKPVLKDILQLAKENNCNNLVFHGFSNNGCVLYHSFQRNFVIDRDIKVAAGIYDSCPGIVDVPSFYKALFAAQVSPFIKYSALVPFFVLPVLILSSNHPLLSTGSLFAVYLSTTFLIQKKYDLNHIQTNVKFSEYNPKYQELYLYSEGDRVVNHKVIEAAIARVKNESDNVKEVKFDNSDHCAHYPKYPMKYSKSILQFIKQL